MKISLVYIFLFLYIVTSAQDFSRKTFFQNKWVQTVGCKKISFSRDTFNVMDFGAYNNGVFNTTKQIQKTIDACYKAGGGVVFVPSGKYLTGSLFLKSNIHLLFSDSVVIYGSTELEDYPEAMTRIAGIEMVWPQALINITNADNVKISGNADIIGRGKIYWNKFHYMKPLYEAENLRWALDYDCKRPRMLVVNDSRNVIVKDITLRESPFWTIQILYSSQITIDGIYIRNKTQEHGPSTDGIDIDSSENVLVQNCDVECQDDNFCIKSGRDADGLRVNRPSRFIVLQNNKTAAGSGLVVFGSETSGGINHVYVNNMIADGTTRGIRFKSARTRGGVIEKILVENIKINNTPFVFEFTMDWNPEYSYTSLPESYKYDEIPEHWKTLLGRVDPPEKGFCQLRNVIFSNFTISGKCWKAFNVEGFEKFPISNFLFENVKLHTETAGEIKNARNWKLINSSFIYDDEQAPGMVNCKEMDTFMTKIKK